MLTKLTCYVGKDNVLCFEELPVSLSKSKYYTGKSTKQDDEDWPESIDFMPNKSEEEKEDAEAAEPTEKDCPYCFSKINIKATRCPHCTAQL